MAPLLLALCFLSSALHGVTIGDIPPYTIRFTISGTVKYSVTTKGIDDKGNTFAIENNTLSIPSRTGVHEICRYILTSNQYQSKQFTYTLSWGTMKHQEADAYLPYTLVIKQASAVVHEYPPLANPATKQTSQKFSVTTKGTGSGLSDYEICTIAIAIDADAFTSALAGTYQDTIVLTQVTT